MKSPSKMTCLFAASFMSITPYTPQQFLSLAKDQVSVSEKISILKRLSDSFPLDTSAQAARDPLVNLLISSNRYEEALQIYQKAHPEAVAPGEIDFRRVELLLRTGRFSDVLKATTVFWGPERDILRDMKRMEFQVEALLAKGEFRLARQSVESWLSQYETEIIPGSRFDGDVHSLQFLKRHLMTLERIDGPKGKSIFTAAVPDSLQHWSKRREVPIVFFKLIPAHPGGQLHEPLLPGRHDEASYFEDHVADINRGFSYVSGDQFSLKFAGLHTLYVKEGDLDPESSGGLLLTSRVYIHTLPKIYKLAGEAFEFIIDYREQADGEAAYMGD